MATIPDPAPDVLRRVLARHDWRCCVCGRPCREGDVWRHTEPGAGGDGPGNFSAMCPACIAAWVAKGAAPARYIVHVRDPGAAWARLRRVVANGLTVTILLVYGGFAGFVAWLVARMPRGGDWPTVTTVTVLLLLMFLALIVRGLLDRWQGRSAQRVAVHEAEREWTH
jgi:hypothetical protein